MLTRTCVSCGVTFQVSRGQRSMCFPCCNRHLEERERARYEVIKATRRGLIPPARSMKCTDCGAAAQGYDHRDYTKPLDVEPVCQPCNLKRGLGFDSLYRPESESFHTPRIVAALSRACYVLCADDQPK